MFAGLGALVCRDPETGGLRRDILRGATAADFDVCQNPFVFRESEKTNVLKALLGEGVHPLQIAGR